MGSATTVSSIAQIRKMATAETTNCVSQSPGAPNQSTNRIGKSSSNAKTRLSAAWFSAGGANRRAAWLRQNVRKSNPSKSASAMASAAFHFSSELKTEKTVPKVDPGGE